MSFSWVMYSGKLLRALGRHRGDELVVVRALRGGVLAHARRVAGENEAEQMVRVAARESCRPAARASVSSPETAAMRPRS